MAINNIRYLYCAKTGIELIFCKNSTISYPLHNHVSVLTIGIILDGSIALTIDKGTKVYRENETFAIFPYVPHSISARDRYTLLSLCIDKNVANPLNEFQMQNRIRKAQRLIHKTETITEAALATGFYDQSHFIKQFEKYVEKPIEKILEFEKKHGIQRKG